MKKEFKKLALAVLTAILAVGCSRYESVPGDPMKARIYTLDNGLKVYVTVNKETPRIQTMIAVRVGGKNDPADNTGLAHYLEHIMFKGTQSYGTSDYEAEKPLLDRIQALYDVYRTKTDPAERAEIYRQIDSVSYEASKIAIANEYDKLMAMIGAQGTNAFTSSDVTCYVEDIPSNQVENWAKVQADRFKNMVVRGFHTELEAVYEEYNMGLTEDMSRTMEATDSVLFPSHPYGRQTVIGTQQHLKNPDISAIIRQKDTYYVPNNCAICASGDVDPDAFVATIERWFGDWKPNPDIPELEVPEEAPITAPVEKHVWGNDAEFVSITWRYPGSRFEGSQEAEIVSSLLYNGMAGLLDLDVNQQQKALGAYCFNYDRADHGELILEGMAQDGQSLEEVRDIILEEVEKLRKGDFDEELLDATIANFRLEEMRQLQNNRSRAMKFVDSFINHHEWKDDVQRIDRLSRLEKDDIAAWAQKWLSPESYVLVYKHTGEDKSIKKIQAPKITPIETNRDKQSDFLAEVQASEVKPIEPVFTDFEKDLDVFQAQGLEVLYKKNENNGIADLRFVFDKGKLSDPALDIAFAYAGYLGTPTRSAEEIAMQMYALACEFDLSVTDEQAVVRVSGLEENLGDALEIVSDLIANAEADEEVLMGLKADLMKARSDSKLSQDACFSAMTNYVLRGPEYIEKVTLDSDALNALTSEELLGKVRGLFGFQHKVLYYGPGSEASLRSLLAEHHAVGDNLVPLERQRVVSRQTPSPKVYIAHYDARQFSYIQYSDRGETYDPAEDPATTLFNEYYGGGMNSVVFQEMREARALAYSAYARLNVPAFAKDTYSFYAFIGSQNDKLRKSVGGFDEIITTMPESDKAFTIAKTGLDAKLRTQRTVGSRVLDSYLAARDLGLTEPKGRRIFEALPSLTMDDLRATHAKWVAGRTYVYGIVGDTRDLDMEFLKSLGPVEVLSLEQIFGY